LQTPRVKSVQISGSISGWPGALPAVTTGADIFTTPTSDVYGPVSLSWYAPNGQTSPFNYSINSYAVVDENSSGAFANFIIFDSNTSPMPYTIFSWGFLAGGKSLDISIETEGDNWICTNQQSLPSPSCGKTLSFYCKDTKSTKVINSYLSIC
jgi:hypothetical protein